jgi:superfamily II DNA helicase RecQ
MQISILTLEFSEKLKGFDNDQLQKFLAGKEIITCTKEFYLYKETPYLTFILEYSLLSPLSPPLRVSPVEEENREEQKHSPTDLLSAEEQDLFEKLRYWRNHRAKKEGYSNYIIFTNKQLMEIARKKPKTLNALDGISGIGNGKVSKYGTEIVELISHQDLKSASIRFHPSLVQESASLPELTEKIHDDN